MPRYLQIFFITVMTATWLAGEVIYRETFDQGNGSTGPQQGWTVGKNTEINRGPETWHKNILGYMGWGAPLEWIPQGGRSGGYATSSSPWYFDDNHGEFYWFHIVLRVRQTGDIGIQGRDLRNARVELSLKGARLGPKRLETVFLDSGRGRTQWLLYEARLGELGPDIRASGGCPPRWSMERRFLSADPRRISMEPIGFDQWRSGQEDPGHSESNHGGRISRRDPRRQALELWLSALRSRSSRPPAGQD